MKLNNLKVIVVNGIQRGGTNVVWNILQSHPQVCAPKPETGRLLHERRISDLFWRYFLIYCTPNPLVAKSLGGWADQIFFDSKMQVLEHEDDQYKSEHDLYTEQEVRDSVLCIKSVNEDVMLADFFSQIYDDCYFVGVVRNGYAVCDSWTRRGRSAKRAGWYYRTYVERMINDSQKYNNYIIVKLEDTLREPFPTASKLYEFAQLSPPRLDKLRLESKKVFNANGVHQAKFGEARKKYWFTEDKVFDILDADISQRQAGNLSIQDKKEFDKQAASVMEYFDYR